MPENVIGMGPHGKGNVRELAYAEGCSGGHGRPNGVKKRVSLPLERTGLDKRKTKTEKSLVPVLQVRASLGPKNAQYPYESPGPPKRPERNPETERPQPEEAEAVDSNAFPSRLSFPDRMNDRVETLITQCLKLAPNEGLGRARKGGV